MGPTFFVSLSPLQNICDKAHPNVDVGLDGANSRRDVSRQRKNLLADYVVNMIFFLKEIIEHPLGLTEGAPLMGEVRKFAFPEAVQD